LIERGDFVGAFHVFDQYLNGDFTKYPTYYSNITGLTSYMNVRRHSPLATRRDAAGAN